MTTATPTTTPGATSAANATALTPTATPAAGGGEVKPVVSLNEVQWLTDLGLGRGVDATKPNLWKEKSSFQVQAVSKSLNNIIGTQESGARKYFEREVLSISSRQTQLKLSVADPNTSLQIGVDAMYSQSVTKTNKSVGEEVATRTISFRRGFNELPRVTSAEVLLQEGAEAKPLLQQLPTSIKPSDTDLLSVAEKITRDGSSTIGTIDDEVRFEEQLCDWLVHRAVIRGKKMEITGKDQCSITKLAHFLQTHEEEDHDCVASDCLLFIKQLGVTHYVHTIQLGAKKFRVLSSTEFNQKVGVKGSVGAQRVAKLQSSISQTASKTRKNSSLQVEEIGKITNGTVQMGTSDEAVISFRLMPIHTLITSEHVNKALKKALRDYMVERAIKSKGPFLISCVNRETTLYWRVDNSNKISASPDVKTASIFFLTSTDDDQHPYEFMITYYGEDKDALMRPKGTLDPMSKEERLAPLPQYLDGSVSLLGYNDGPLEVKPNVAEENARFVIYSRVFDVYAPVDIKEWELGEQFFINCSRRRFRIDGYVAVSATKTEGEYTTSIIPFQQNHNGIDTWMLFRLMPEEYRSRELNEHSTH